MGNIPVLSPPEKKDPPPKKMTNLVFNRHHRLTQPCPHLGLRPGYNSI